MRECMLNKSVKVVERPGRGTEMVLFDVDPSKLRLELRKAHKAHNQTQPNPQMGWALGPTFGPTGGLWA
ncbi:unnamed protein product [Penicillium camemberti]|uniref:Str. FM013 n=1 Tax=Penicillium camemberti (strain FM 013) TaxID=1429867 RepID=A0A0G4PUN8_PENC3|nr:unnamed protein product [Penicillium camemberti]